jgi:hypothetical protein
MIQEPLDIGGLKKALYVYEMNKGKPNISREIKRKQAEKVIAECEYVFLHHRKEYLPEDEGL